MKKFSTLFIITLSVSLFLVSCKQSVEKKQNTPNNLEVKELEKPAPLVVLNANLATESDLVALGLSEEVVQKLFSKYLQTLEETYLQSRIVFRQFYKNLQ